MKCSAFAQIIVEDDWQHFALRAIPELIKVLELSGCLVPIEAMGTLREIAKLIQNKSTDDCLALKGNHQYLHERVIHLFEQGEAID